MRVGILGITGYSGMTLYSLLAQHPKVTEIVLYGNAQHQADLTLQDVVPAFGNNPQPIQAFNTAKVQQETDCLFCATPSGVTAHLVGPLLATQFPVIDLSGDFRLHSAKLYQHWYHQTDRILPDAAQITYGLSEFTDSYQSYIANPGCYATATLLALAPLAKAGLLESDFIVVDAKSGVSGAGKNPSASAHFPTINENLQVYRLNQHQHIPEIMQQLKEWDGQLDAIQFSTTLLPITRGIMVNIYAKIKHPISQSAIEQLFQQTYAQSPFVRLRGATLPTIKEVVGSNFCDIGINWNPRTQIVTLVSVIDNLMKGAAGQAVQNFNKYFGFEETLSLPKYPLFP